MTLKFFCKLMKVYFRNCELGIYDRKLRSHFNASGRKLMNVYWLSKWPLCSYGNPYMSQTIAEMYAGSRDRGELCRLWINLYTPFGPLGLKWAKREAVCFPGEWLAYEWCFEEKFKDTPCQLQNSCLPSIASPLWFSDACDSYFTRHLPWLSSTFVAGIDIGIDKLHQQHN